VVPGQEFAHAVHREWLDREALARHRSRGEQGVVDGLLGGLDVGLEESLGFVSLDV
jgi:hypothetical protein